MFVFSHRFFAIAGFAAILAGCNAQSPIPSSSPDRPFGRHRAHALTAAPTKLNFTTKPALKLTVSEAGYTGAFKFSVSPSKLVNLKPAKGNGPSITLTITAVNAGTGTFTAKDANGKSVGVPITVTKGVIIIQ